MVKCSQNKHNPLLRGTKDKADYRNNLEPEIKETSNSLPSKQESDINAFRPLRVPPSAFETDFLGMINFCLRNVDNTLSGPSRSKVLNEISNDVFKAIVIGYAPLIADVVVKFPVYKTMIERTECKLDRGLNSDTGDTVIIDNCDLDLQVSLIYMNWLQDLIERGVAHVSEVYFIAFMLC